MASNPFFSGRIPNELKQQVEKYCEENNKTKTDFMIEAFQSFLGLPITNKTNNSGITQEMFLDLKTMLFDLRNRVERIEEKPINENTVNHDPITDNTVISNDNGEIEKTKVVSKVNQMSVSKEEIEENTKILGGKLLTTNEVTALPGVDKKDIDRIKTKLRNAKSQNKTPVEIGAYLLDIAGKEPGSKGALLWKIVQDNT
jgi:hypothetical protein